MCAGWLLIGFSKIFPGQGNNIKMIWAGLPDFNILPEKRCHIFVRWLTFTGVSKIFPGQGYQLKMNWIGLPDCKILPEKRCHIFVRWMTFHWSFWMNVSCWRTWSTPAFYHHLATRKKYKKYWYILFISYSTLRLYQNCTPTYYLLKSY